MRELRVHDVLELGRALLGLDVDRDAVARRAVEDVQLEVRVGRGREPVVDDAAAQRAVALQRHDLARQPPKSAAVCGPTQAIESESATSRATSVTCSCVTSSSSEIARSGSIGSPKTIVCAAA